MFWLFPFGRDRVPSRRIPSRVTMPPPTTPKRLDQKLARIRAGQATRRDFIIADAKDADMAFGATAPGLRMEGESVPGGRLPGWKTRADSLQQIREIVAQDVVDIMLLSASNLERLAVQEGRFRESAVTAAARANDSSDIWLVRGGAYRGAPSLPFRSASIEHIQYGRQRSDGAEPVSGADLGLYSVTFNNDAVADHRTLEAFAAFRREAEEKRFRYFLEVFAPNLPAAVARPDLPGFLCDSIVRLLAGIAEAGRPLFLKVPYLGPRFMTELTSYDPGVVVGVMGGAAGTTMDAFLLLHEAQAHGAWAALLGRKINQAESPLRFIAYLRRIADGEISPAEAVRAYHAELAQLGLKPQRDLSADLQVTERWDCDD